MPKASSLTTPSNLSGPPLCGPFACPEAFMSLYKVVSIALMFADRAIIFFVLFALVSGAGLRWFVSLDTGGRRDVIRLIRALRRR